MTIGDYYDENGNIQELETLLQVNWNYRDNISNGVTVERTGNINDAEYYVYDASGQRIRKVKETLTSVVNNTVEIEEKIYTSNVETKKIRVVQGGSTTILTRTSLHVMDDTRRIATVHNWTVDTLEREINAQGELNTNKIRYQYGNHIDSASLELSSTGAIISYEEYFPYGDTSFMAGTSQKEVKIKEYRYTGKEKDDATGLYYYGARYYASWLGRWMSADPLFRENPNVYDRPKGSTAEEQKQLNTEYMQKLYHEGLNMYCYVKGNPVTFSDPSGREIKDWNLVVEINANDNFKKGIIKNEPPNIKPVKSDKVIESYTIDLSKNLTIIADNKQIAKSESKPEGESIEKGVILPLKGISVDKINSLFGWRKLKEKDNYHPGIDIMTKTGTPIYAVASGKVNFADFEPQGYGNMVKIEHGKGVETLYAHQSKMIVKEGDHVKKGQLIGYSGGKPGTKGAGSTTGEHVHFEIRVKGKSVDPLKFKWNK